VVEFPGDWGTWSDVLELAKWMVVEHGVTSIDEGQVWYLSGSLSGTAEQMVAGWRNDSY
jgi:hypothetical protein